MGNEVGDSGAQALAALKDAASLQTLVLDLELNNVGAPGAQGLVALRQAPALRTLTLDLARNRLGDVGVQALAELKDAPALQTLTLNLAVNQVTCLGAQVAAASASPASSPLPSLLCVFCLSLLFAVQGGRWTADGAANCRGVGGRWMSVGHPPGSQNPVPPLRDLLHIQYAALPGGSLVRTREAPPRH